MDLLNKIKESTISVLPISIIVALLHFTVADTGDKIWAFCLGSVLVIIGLGIFLFGADLGMVPIGQKTGTALISKRNMPLLLCVGFIIGFLVTIAEPDVQVLATQVVNVAPSISSSNLVLMIGIGVGLFITIATVRILLQFSLKILFAILYLLTFIIAYFTDPKFLGIAFDAGGATTGPLTVPFIMALGVGLAFARSGKNAEKESFGFIGLSSIGPILSVLIFGILFSNSNPPITDNMNETMSNLSIISQFIHHIPEVIKEVIIAIGPLAFLFAIFQIFLIKMPARQVIRMAIGLFYTSIGLILFFTGVKGGFMPVGIELGRLIACHENRMLLIFVGLLLGAVVVCAEPAVWILNEQVEELSGGNIKKNIMLASLSVGVSCAVCIAMFRVQYSISLWWFVIPGYSIAILLSYFCPQMFTAIAFDSGGVASGPMASTFILAFALGASQAMGGNPELDAFGVIALIAMTPLLTIQVLGILYSNKIKKHN